jgi:hypothetical protein
MLSDPRKRGPENTERHVKNRAHDQQDDQVQQILDPKTEISVARIASENGGSKSEKENQSCTHHDGGEHGRQTLD